ncbi:MAG: rod shape-determining protein MreD [Oleiphilus sp.]
MHARFSWMAVFVSFLIASVLELIILPDSFQNFRPEWVSLTLIYWLLRYPEKVGLFTAACLGLVMDVISGYTLGASVLGYSVSTYLVLSMHHRLKMFPVTQQAVVIFFLVGIQLMIVYLLSIVLQGNVSGLSYLWQALTSAIAWPLVLILTDRLALSLR